MNSFKTEKNLAIIAPSILSADFSCLEKQIKCIEQAGVKVIHVDVMDGHFVPNLTIGPLVVKALKKITQISLDVHLMIQNPQDFILPFSEAGADWLTFHCEVPGHHHMMIQKIKELGMKAGIALNPATPLNTIEWLIKDLDLILIMSVNPGFGGQAFIPGSLKKIMKAREYINNFSAEVILAVDGGVKIENCEAVALAGADLLVMGSAIFEASDPGLKVKEAKERLSRIK